MVLIQSYGRTGARSWKIGDQAVELKPFRRGRKQVEEPKPPEPVVETKPPVKPKPEKKIQKWQTQDIEVSLTIVIGGKGWEFTDEGILSTLE